MSHYSNEPRERFLEALDTYAFSGDGLADLKEAAFALWNCTDILPGDARQMVDDLVDNGSEPFTYAQAARRVRELG